MLALTPGEDRQAVVALAIEKEGHKVIRVTVGGEGRSQQLAGIPGLTTPSRKFCLCFEDEVAAPCVRISLNLSSTEDLIWQILEKP
jgi:hypothetical protein